MGIAANYNNDLGIEITVWSGIITKDQWVASTQQKLDDPLWPPKKRKVLTDVRFANLDESITEAVLEQIAGVFGGSGKDLSHIKSAIVSGETFRTARIFEHFIKQFGVSTIVFNDISTACVWLGIDTKKTYKLTQELLESLRE